MSRNFGDKMDVQQSIFVPHSLSAVTFQNNFLDPIITCKQSIIDWQTGIYMFVYFNVR